jgi:NAD(P)-dependent dehydrogenase (short-subunit alcohol dehydrogenase family)
MNPDFAGKRVLVTGSTRGIGMATALEIQARGGELVWHGRRIDDARRAAAVSGGSAVAGDLADRGACRRIAAEAGVIDVLVNCAGVLIEGPAHDVTEAMWDTTMAVNLTAAWVLSRALLPVLRDRRGVIVNVASDAALLGYASLAAYCASKGAIVGLTKALAVELAPKVRAIAVCPGPVETDMMRASLAASPDPDSAARGWSAPTMLRRVASAQEIAKVIAFAASPSASYMTGNVILVDGGATAGRRVGLADAIDDP